MKSVSLLVRVLPLVLIACAFSGSADASSFLFSVAGTSNPFLAGMPPGSSCCSGDSLPAEAPLLAGLVINGGDTLTFTGVSGSVSYAGGSPTDPPDGDTSFLITTSDYEGGFEALNGIAGFTSVPVNALIGVFLGPGQPDLTAAPSSLDFSSGGLGLAFSSLSPGLKQAFFIGDGLTGTGSGSVQTFIAPTGATRLFLGTVDGFGWFNDTGAISGTVTDTAAGTVPEPGSLLLLGVALTGLVTVARQKRTLG